MNDVKVTRVFREAWIFVTEYYFVWLKGLLLVGIPLAVLGWFLFPLVSSWSYRSILVLTCLAFIIAFGFAYVNKFALTVIRNPQMVKLYLAMQFGTVSQMACLLASFIPSLSVQSRF